MPKVFVVNRPIRNKFGWTPDLSDASRYGSIEVVFEPDDNPQFVPSPMIMKARKIMWKTFFTEDITFSVGGGDQV